MYMCMNIYIPENIMKSFFNVRRNKNTSRWQKFNKIK